MTTDPVALALIQQLRKENQELRAVIARLENRIAELVAENKALQDQLDDDERQAARQAAPFRRRESKKIPEERQKRPGRPKGHPGAHRAVPTHLDDHAEVPLTCCPRCGGEVEGGHGGVCPAARWHRGVARPAFGQGNDSAWGRRDSQSDRQTS